MCDGSNTNCTIEVQTISPVGSIVLRTTTASCIPSMLRRHCCGQCGQGAPVKHTRSGIPHVVTSCSEHELPRLQFSLLGEIHKATSSSYCGVRSASCRLPKCAPAGSEDIACAPSAPLSGAAQHLFACRSVASSWSSGNSHGNDAVARLHVFPRSRIQCHEQLYSDMLKVSSCRYRYDVCGACSVGGPEDGDLKSRNKGANPNVCSELYSGWAVRGRCGRRMTTVLGRHVG
jgi:hypothetical protein